MTRLPTRRPGPIQAAVDRWLRRPDCPISVLEKDSHLDEQLLETSPKRYTIYEPMALLPPGSFASEPWASLLSRQGPHTRDALWSLILEELSLRGNSAVTHLAVNEGIPLHQEGQAAENVRRSPSSLRTLFGDFGPNGMDGSGEPTGEDFERAFWAGTKQNGIRQTWAPRWTMFSRGNVKEKARLLAFGRPETAGEVDQNIQKQQRREPWAVDLYAGIGYFAFSYAALGMRVLCWEINPWSVEALRRGATANRWTVNVVQGHALQQQPLEEIMAGDEQITVFLESNEHAAARIGRLQDMGLAHNITHVNCGFLPTSEPVWRSAWGITRKSTETRLHLHLNVGVADLESRRRSIQGMFDDWAALEELEEEEEEEKEEKEEKDGVEMRVPTVEHVEQVKTYAPGVWHCVYDVHIVQKCLPPPKPPSRT